MTGLPYRRRIAVAFAVLVAIVGLAVAPSADRAAAQDGGAAVDIAGFAFAPGSIEVVAGTTVTWTNSDAAPHTVTAADGSFDSGELAQGQSYSLTFDTPGSYAYACAIHPQMTGTVVVTAAAAAPEAAAPAAADTAATTATTSTTAALPSTGSGPEPDALSAGFVPFLVVLLICGGAVFAGLRRI
jgi:plastocyanin